MTNLSRLAITCVAVFQAFAPAHAETASTSIRVATRCWNQTYACGTYVCGYTRVCGQSSCVREPKWCTQWCTRRICG